MAGTSQDMWSKHTYSSEFVLDVLCQLVIQIISKSLSNVALRRVGVSKHLKAGYTV